MESSFSPVQNWYKFLIEWKIILFVCLFVLHFYKIFFISVQNKSLSPFNLPLNGSILFDNGSINDNGRTDENNLDWSTGKLFIPKEAALIGFVLAIMIGIVGMLGNLMTIAALYKHQTLNKMHSRATTMFVIHLAIADFLFCLLVMPITSGRYLTQTWPFGSTLCRLYPMVYYGTVATSLMLITIITINR